MVGAAVPGRHRPLPQPAVAGSDSNLMAQYQGLQPSMQLKAHLGS